MRWINANKGLVVLAVLAVLAVCGTWLSRTGADDRRAAGDATVPVNTAAIPAAAGTTSPSTPAAGAAAAPSTSAAVRGDRLDVPVDPSAARRQRDESGARQAVIDYMSTVKQRVMYLGPVEARMVVESWTAVGVAAAEIDDALSRLAQVRDALTAAGGQMWWAVTPLAVKVEAFNADQARVSVWTASVMASGAAAGTDAIVAAPQVAYFTSTVELLWDTSRGWSVWSTVDVAGPVPLTATGQVPSTPNEFLGQLAGFSLIKEHS